MISRPTNERVNQKSRTREALLRAAREFVAQGHTPSIQQVADAALVSKATAYRYFPTQEALLVELLLDEDAPTLDSLFGDGGPAGIEDRVALVHNAFYDLARDHEAEFRVFLRASLARSLQRGAKEYPLRGARRDALLAEALAPLTDELPPDELAQLRRALAVLIGVESMIVLRDVLGLEHQEGRDVTEWAVRELVRSARHRATG